MLHKNMGATIWFQCEDGAAGFQTFIILHFLLSNVETLKCEFIIP